MAATLFALCPLTPIAPDGLANAATTPPVPRGVWTVQFPGYVGMHLGPASSRTLAMFFTDTEQVYVPSKVLAAAVNTQTGALAWKNASLPPGKIPGFAADSERLYLLLEPSHQVSAWRWDTGQRLWAARALNGLVAQDGRVVWVAYDGYLTAADGATGRKLWDRAFAPTDDWTPVTLALGNVYLFARREGRASYRCSSAVIVLDLETGASVRKGVFNPDLGCQYVFDYLRWAPRAQVFYGQDGIEGRAFTSGRWV